MRPILVSILITTENIFQTPATVAATLDANLSSQQRPNKIAFFRQKTEPRAAVSRDLEIGFPNMTFRHFHCLITNDDRSPTLFVTGEGEMVCSIEALGLVSLKGQGQPSEKPKSSEDDSSCCRRA